jgi:hypothetical protein
VDAFCDSQSEVKTLTGDTVALLGNIPPRDCLASSPSREVTRLTTELIDSLQEKSGVIPGRPPLFGSLEEGE